MFCKIYDTDLGQILVKKDSCDDTDNPELRFYFEPKELGICQMALKMKDDSESSWECMDRLFDDMTEENAYRTVKNIIDGMLSA